MGYYGNDPEELRDAVSGPRLFLPVAEHEKGANNIAPLSICTDLSAHGYMPKNST
jgi:hypothetical protein